MLERGDLSVRCFASTTPHHSIPIAMIAAFVGES